MVSKRKFKYRKQARLLTRAQFKIVFDNNHFRSSDNLFTVLAAENELYQSRLGIIVAKRQVKKAHHRNRVKRYVRESFRLQQCLFPAVDIIVIAKVNSHLKQSSKVMHSLQRHWLRMTR